MILYFWKLHLAAINNKLVNEEEIIDRVSNCFATPNELKDLGNNH